MHDLNAPTPQARLAALQALAGEEFPPVIACQVNNHIHTTYSFSPYSPTRAVWEAKRNGLATAGIMDHDSMAGAEEFLAAGAILAMPVTCGIECRVSFRNTPFGTRRLNNPDQDGVVYLSLHGVPRRSFGAVQAFFAPHREARNRRNRRMVQNCNELLGPHGVTIDFDLDVLPLSQWGEGGAVTERHLALALANRILDVCGDGQPLLDFLRGPMGIALSPKSEGQLLDGANPHRAYDILGLIKGHYVPRFYVPAGEECPDVRDLLVLGRQTGAIVTYPYLGDVGDSVTGDKRTQRFEDDILEELLVYLKELGVQAVTYMPTRNTPAQLARLRGLCRQLGFFQVSGEDINSPRQSFLCQALYEPAFANLIDAAWALIGHERASDDDPEGGMFSERTIARLPDMEERVRAFSREGRRRYGQE